MSHESGRRARTARAIALLAGWLKVGCDAPVDVLQPRDAGIDASGSAAIDSGSGDTGAGDTGAGDTGTPTAEESVAAVAAGYCDWMSTCAPAVLRFAFWGGIEQCLEYYVTEYAPVHARGHAPDPSLWCLTSLENDPDCDGRFECEAPPGDLREGEACLHDRECGLTSTRAPMYCDDCRCVPFAREGESCAARECAPEPNLRCVRLGAAARCTILTFVALGEACDATFGPFCPDGADCVEGICTARPRLGESCVPAGDDPELERAPCELPFRGTDDRACVLGDDGYRCRDLWADFVAAGAPCAPGDSCVSGGMCPFEGVCPAQCGRSASCNSPDMVCIDGECVNAPDECAP